LHLLLFIPSIPCFSIVDGCILCRRCICYSFSLHLMHFMQAYDGSDGIKSNRCNHRRLKGKGIGIDRFHERCKWWKRKRKRKRKRKKMKKKWKKMENNNKKKPNWFFYYFNWMD
jgi:hypothetical protein